MRDARYETCPGLVVLLALPADDETRWPFPAANGTSTWVEISQAHAEHFLNVLPPLDWRGGGFFVGEPSTNDHRGVTVYARVERAGGRWWIRDLPRDAYEDARLGLLEALGVVS